MSFSFFWTPQQQPFFQPQQPPVPQQPYFQPPQWRQQQPFFQPQQPPALQQPYFQPQQSPPPQQPHFQPHQWQQRQPFFQPQQLPMPQQPTFQIQQWQQQQPFFQTQQSPEPQQQAFFQPQEPPLPQQQQVLFIIDGTAATDNTKWEDLHPQSQNFILQIEERVVMYRNESERLDQWSRLYEHSVSNDGFKFDASHIKQVLDGIRLTIKRPMNLQQELTSSVTIMSRDTQKAVSNFNRLTDVSGKRYVDLGLPKRPSSFLCETVARFDKHLGECRRWIEELERLLGSSERNTFSDGSFSSQSLHQAMANVHDFFIRVAAKVESRIHQHMDDMRSTCLVKQGRRQEKHDPFQVADQRDTARKEVASKRLRPTSHSPEVSQTSTELAGLFYSSGTVPAQASPLTSNSLGSGLSFFRMPCSVPPSFSSPQTSNSSRSDLSGFSMPCSVPFSSAVPQTSPLTSNSSGSGLSVFSMPSSVPFSSAVPQTSPLTSNSSGSGLSGFSMPYSVPFSSVVTQTSPLTSNSSGSGLSVFSMPSSVPFSSAVPQTSPVISNSSGSGLSGFSMPSSVPSSSVPALYMTPTTSAQVFPLFGSSSATSCPERVLEVVHQASMETSKPSPRSQTSLLYSISGTIGASTAPQTSPPTSNSGSSNVISYRRGRFTVSEGTMRPSATSQASLLNSSSSSLSGSSPSHFGGTAPSRGTTSGASTSASPSFSPGPATRTGTASTSILKRPRSRTNLSQGDSSRRRE